MGDFIVSLPCFHLVRRRYPRSQIALLTNEPISKLAAPAKDILNGTGVVDQYITYAGGTYNPKRLVQLRREIRSLNPDLLIYLVKREKLASVYRDQLFFRWCGIRNCIGLPRSRESRRLQPPSSGTLWESEAGRLGRTLVAIGRIELTDPASFDLCLSAAEVEEAKHILGALPAGVSRRLVGLSIGTKQSIKDWGDHNWEAVLHGIAHPGLGLILFGAEEDLARSGRLAEAWPGPVLNLCGRIPTRLSAAVLRHVSIFLCHDSGPMHLAAAVSTKCVAVFSRHRPPGQWFPCGEGHRIFYPASVGDTIQSICPDPVVAAIREILGTVQAKEKQRSG